jgi:hypothetical protein
MDEDKSSTPEKPTRADFTPVEFYDYGLGKRISPRRKRRPGEPQPLCEGHDWHPHDE